MDRTNFVLARALVVDDNEDYANSTAALLRLALYCEATTCTNSADVMEAVKAHRPQLLLLDLTMEPLDGFAVIEQLKVHDVLPPLAVAVSGHSGEGVTARCLAAGFHCHVVKPMALGRLHELVREAIERTPKCLSTHC